MSEENKALARRVSGELYNSRGTLDAADDIYAPDVVAHDPNSPGDMHGPEGVKHFASGFRAFPDRQSTVEDQIAEGDKVVTRYTFSGTHQGEFLGIPPTGNRVQMTGMYMSRISGGKIVEEWNNYDLLGLMIGSEGLLGVVTEVTAWSRLRPAAGHWAASVLRGAGAGRTRRRPRPPSSGGAGRACRRSRR